MDERISMGKGLIRMLSLKEMARVDQKISFTMDQKILDTVQKENRNVDYKASYILLSSGGAGLDQ